MKIDYQEIRNDLYQAQMQALECYESNKQHGASIESVSYDSGVYNGFKQAIEILDKLWDGA
jgi:hypothetical protein